MSSMHKFPYVFLLLFFCAIASAQQYPVGPSDGQIHALKDGSLEAWDAVGEQWLDPVSFWLAYAGRRGGLTWGRGQDYPTYADVSEFDTFMIEVDSGPCLMQFFHTRWRRAQDVRRWDERFNTYGGCPDVFK